MHELLSARSTMKLLLILPVFFYCVLVQKVFVYAQATTHPPEGASAASEDRITVRVLEDSAALGSGMAQVISHILGMIEAVPGFQYIAELSRKGLDKAKELGNSVLPYIKEYSTMKNDLIHATNASSHQLMDKAIDIGKVLVNKIAEIGAQIVQSSTVGAHHFTDLSIGGVESLIAIFNNFTQSFHKINKLLNDTRLLLRPHLDENE